MDLFDALPRYSKLQPSELARLRDVRERVFEQAAAFYSAAAPDRVTPVAIRNFASITVTFAPATWTVDDCAVFVLYVCWAGLIKEHHMDHPTLARTAKFRRSVGDAACAGLGDATGAVDPQIQEVATYLRDLLALVPPGSGLPNFLPLFKQMVRREMDADVRAWELAETATRTDVLVEDYLENASWTVELRSHLVLQLHLLMKTSEPISDTCLAELRLAFDAASVSVRLINDFATSSANDDEGVLSIYSFGWAKEDVVRRAHDFLDRAVFHITRAETMGLAPAHAESLRTHVRLAVEAYHATDLRDHRVTAAAG